MENNSEKQTHICRGWCYCGEKRGISFLGIFLLIVGTYFLALSFGWISGGFPLWQMALIGFGVYFITKRLRK